MSVDCDADIGIKWGVIYKYRKSPPLILIYIDT